MARNAGHVWAVIALLLVPGAVTGQTPDRARELEARQAARLQARQAARSAVFGIDPYDAAAYRCDPYGPVSPPGSSPWTGSPGWTPWSGCPYPDRAWYGVSTPPGFALGTYGYGGYGHQNYGHGAYGHGYGYGLLPAPPNPYRDWARLWGRGWLDGQAVPPYHRFQYRFFPETLPDPTREGYVTAREWYGEPSARPLPAAPDCVRIEMDLGGETPEIFATRLPALGAGTAEALEAVIRDRLGRGGGVVLRAYDGHVVQLPPVEAIRSLTVAPCAAPVGR